MSSESEPAHARQESLPKKWLSSFSGLLLPDGFVSACWRSFELTSLPGGSAGSGWMGLLWVASASGVQGVVGTGQPQQTRFMQ